MTGRVASTDLDGWLRARVAAGDHVVTLTPRGYALLHPGCDGGCPFTGKPLQVTPTPAQPVYLAELDDDGIRPIEHHAPWEDVVANELPD